MARPRIHSDRRSLNGTLQPVHDRLEIVPAGTPQVPEFLDLTDEARRVFDYLVATCVVPQAHGTADGLLLAQLARAVADAEGMRRSIDELGYMTRNYNTGRMEVNPLVAELRAVDKQILRLYADLGLSPTARLRLAPPKSEQPSLWDDEDGFEDVGPGR